MAVIGILDFELTKINSLPMVFDSAAHVEEFHGESAIILSAMAIAPRARKIVLFCVLANCAIRRKAWRQPGHTMAHFLHPGLRDTGVVALVKARRDLIF